MNEFFQDFFVFKLWKNATQHHGPTITRVGHDNESFRLAVIDFDDQGMCFDRRRIGDLDQCLTELEGTWPIIVAFVHGWKHNASPSDDNLALFKTMLGRLARSIAGDVAAAGGSPGQGSPILGVYLGWRGASRRGNWLWQQSSFWGRQRAAQRVAAGSTREVLGKLKAFRNGPAGSTGPRATFVVVGHSFGGLIVYTALAQSLIEAAATNKTEMVPSFGDLVLLVNPAFSAMPYMPISEIVSKRQDYAPGQRPVCVSVTAENDWATKYAFPIGNWYRNLREAWRGARQRQALTRTMGHLKWLRTHALYIDGGAQSTNDAEAVMRARDAEASFGSVRVKNVDGHTLNPFWVASATPDVIDGHNGIGGAAFEDFVAHLVAGRIQVGSP